MRLSSVLFAALLAAASTGTVTPFHLVAASFTYQLTVTESATSMTTSDSSPSFRATLVPPADDPSLNPGNFYVSIGSLNEAGTLTSTSSPYGLYVSGLAPFSLGAGSYQVVAKYQSPNHGLLTSAPVTLTVTRATPALTCGAGGSYNYPPGAAVTVSATGVTSGAFTVTFSGPQQLTSPPQQLSSNGAFTVTAPTVPGSYTPTCTFEGSSMYAPATVPFDNRVLTVTAAHQVRGISLYTNPAPLRASTPTSWEVVVTGQPGLPAPTGNVSITVGTYFIRPLIALGANGVASFTSTSPPGGASQGIQVVYMGDTNYAASNVHLYTTAAIPGASSANRPAAAASPTASSVQVSPGTDQASPTANASSTPLTEARAAMATASARGLQLRTLAILAMIAAVALVAGVIGLTVIRRRWSEP